MFIYIAIFIVLIWSSFLKRKVAGKNIYILYVLLLSIIVGFRAKDVGTDTASYIAYYFSSPEYMEMGWNKMVLLARMADLSPYFFNWIVAFVSLFFIAYVIAKEVPNSIYGLYFFYAMGFYFLMFNGMRQLLAVAIVFFALYCLQQKKNKEFVLIVLLASLIHTSSLYVLPLVFINKLNVNMRRLVVSIILSLLVGAVLNEDMFISLAGKYAHDVTEESKWGGFRESLGVVYVLLIIQNIFLLFLYRNSSAELKTSFWMKIFIVSMILSNILIRLTLGPRLIYFFATSQVILFTCYQRRRLLNWACIAYSFVNFMRYLLPELVEREGSLIPYQMHFEIFS